jgi:hypothetical protein
MRSARLALTLCILLFAIPSWAKQASQSAPTPQPASDPQAVAVVQAAITALGGATAISQAQSWTFQASLQGPIANGTVSNSVSTAVDSTAYTLLPNGVKRPAPLIRSLFVPVGIGSILLTESQDPRFLIKYRGPMTIGTKNIVVVDFYVSSIFFAVQTWCFDATTYFPISINFRLSAQIGQKVSNEGIVNLSDYHAVSGAQYPFQLSTQIAHSIFPEVVTIRSITPSAAAQPGDYDSSSGDLSQ